MLHLGLNIIELYRGIDWNNLILKQKTLKADK